MPPKRKIDMQEEDPEYQVKRRKHNESVEKSHEKSNQEIQEVKAGVMERTEKNNLPFNWGYESMWAVVKRIISIS